MTRRKSPKEDGPVLLSTSELRMLEVINVVDGRRMGTVYDLELDVASGRILCLILPGAPRGGLFGWWQGHHEVTVPWDHIVKIGIDVILVRLPTPTHLEAP